MPPRPPGSVAHASVTLRRVSPTFSRSLVPGCQAAITQSLIGAGFTPRMAWLIDSSRLNRYGLMTCLLVTIHAFLSLVFASQPVPVPLSMPTCLPSSSISGYCTNTRNTELLYSSANSRKAPSDGAPCHSSSFRSCSAVASFSSFNCASEISFTRATVASSTSFLSSSKRFSCSDFSVSTCSASAPSSLLILLRRSSISRWRSASACWRSRSASSRLRSASSSSAVLTAFSSA